jgi:hypothetical protein
MSERDRVRGGVSLTGDRLTHVSRKTSGGEGFMAQEFPQCLKCNTGILLPLSDYGRDGASIKYKAWVCNSPDCGFNLRIDNGEISMGRDITESYK